MSFLWNLVNYPRPFRLRHWIVLWGSIWTLFYLTIVAPTVGLAYLSASRLTIVDAKYFGHRVVRIGSGRKATDVLLATAEFDRPSPSGPVHCIVPGQHRPWAERDSQSAVDVQLAVRSDSCFAFYDVPVMQDVARDMIYAYLFGGLFVLIMGTCSYFDAKFRRLAMLDRSKSGVPLMKASPHK